MAKILVGCPTSDHKAYCLKEYVGGLHSLKGEFDILLVDNSDTDKYREEIAKLKIPVIKGPYRESARDRIVSSRNMLRKKVIDEGYDYFFSLEQDVIPPPQALHELLVHDTDIVSAVYTKKYKLVGEKSGKNLGEKELPLAWVRVGDKTTQMEMDDLDPPRLQQIRGVGLGCMLISRKVLEEVQFHFDANHSSFDDMWFCNDAQKAGFSIFLDTGVLCKHLEMDWKGIKK